jgi:hypothetical protein
MITPKGTMTWVRVRPMDPTQRKNIDIVIKQTKAKSQNVKNAAAVLFRLTMKYKVTLNSIDVANFVGISQSMADIASAKG